MRHAEQREFARVEADGSTWGPLTSRALRREIASIANRGPTEQEIRAFKIFRPIPKYLQGPLHALEAANNVA